MNKVLFLGILSVLSAGCIMQRLTERMMSKNPLYVSMVYGVTVFLDHDSNKFIPEFCGLQGFMQLKVSCYNSKTMEPIDSLQGIMVRLPSWYLTDGDGSIPTAIFRNQFSIDRTHPQNLGIFNIYYYRGGVKVMRSWDDLQD